MSKAMQALKDFLAVSPSVVYPDEVLELLRPVEHENAKLKRRLEILKGHGIEIVDAVAGGFEIYNKEHARADKLQAENAKLRNLIVKAHTCEGRCGDCYPDEGCCPIERGMQELEIEVDA